MAYGQPDGATVNEVSAMAVGSGAVLVRWLARLTWWRHRAEGPPRVTRLWANDKDPLGREDGVRPRAGWIDHANGTRTPLRYVRTEEAGVFLAVTVDRKPVRVGPYDRAFVDVLGPRQRVVFKIRPPRPDEE
jgi:hypothetical protein